MLMARELATILLSRNQTVLARQPIATLILQCKCFKIHMTPELPGGAAGSFTDTCFRNAPSDYKPGLPPCRTCSKNPYQRRSPVECGLSSAPTVAPPSVAPTPVPPPSDSCDFARDGECDEGSYCPAGTDMSDCCEVCEDTCKYSNDGECDEPTYCAPGSDTSDCGSGGAKDGNSCQWANDGMCDEPTYCYGGTDTADCSRRSEQMPIESTPNEKTQVQKIPIDKTERRASEDDWIMVGETRLIAEEETTSDDV